jgi:glycosyltransferase involved in cell wall biosynthesis
MLWTGDSYDVFHTYGIGDKRVVRHIDTLLTVSHWQSQILSAYSDFPLHKTFVLGNGIHPDFFQGAEKRFPKRLIYSSTPHRGLMHIPALFTQLKAKHPELEIHIFSGYDVYGASGVGQYDTLKAELEATPGVVFRGNIAQKELAREFMKSSILFYPCSYEETFCITALEAQAAGCVVVTSKHSALPETVGDAGVLVPGKPGSQEYNSSFVEATDQILKNPELFQKLSEKGKSRARSQTWFDIAKRLDQYLNSPIQGGEKRVV